MKLEKCKVQPSFKDNIWGVDLPDMQLTNTFNKIIPFLLCAFDIYNKQARVVPLKDKKGITNTNPMQEILDESNHKPNKIWADKGN